MGIYDIFSMAAKGAEKVPWRWSLLVGAGAGAAIGATSGDKDTPVMERIFKGAALGAGLGLGVGSVIRGAGAIAGAGGKISKLGITGKIANLRTNGIEALMRPGTLMVGGAVAGAALAPKGHRMQGAAIGAGVGLAARPAMAIFKGYGALGKIPGAQTAALIGAATLPLAASVAFGKGTPDGSGNANSGMGGTLDYNPSSDNMRDRMLAMNASGDIVLGLHGRQHGG